MGNVMAPCFALE